MLSALKGAAPSLLPGDPRSGDRVPRGSQRHPPPSTSLSRGTTGLHAGAQQRGCHGRSCRGSRRSRSRTAAAGAGIARSLVIGRGGQRLPLPGLLRASALPCLTPVLLSFLLVPSFWVTDDLSEHLQGHSSPVPAGRVEGTPAPCPGTGLESRRGGCSSVPLSPTAILTCASPLSLPCPAQAGAPRSCRMGGRGALAILGPATLLGTGGEGGDLPHTGVGAGPDPSPLPVQISAGPEGAEHPSS